MNFSALNWFRSCRISMDVDNQRSRGLIPLTTFGFWCVATSQCTPSYSDTISRIRSRVLGCWDADYSRLRCGNEQQLNVEEAHKASKTRRVIALVTTALSFRSGWELAHQIPGLESRFDNKYILAAILPSAALYSVLWYGAVEQTRLAAAIEAHIDDPCLWRFLLRMLRAFLLQFSSRGIQVFFRQLFSPFRWWLPK